MNVHVQVQRGAKALDDSHGAAAAIDHTASLGLTPQPAEHRAQIDRHHRPAEVVVPRQQVTQARRQSQDVLHPTAHSPRGGDPGTGGWVRREIRGRPGARHDGHAPPTATRAESSPLTGERNQAIESAIQAPEPREPRRQTPARQEVTELLFDEARQSLSVAQMRRLRAEGLEMVAHQLVQGSLLGPTRLIGG